MKAGNRIKELRQIANMSQEELGRRVGVQRAAINKYEKGTVENIPIKTIEKIADIFNVSPVYIVGWDESNFNTLALEVRILQGIKRFYGSEAIDLLETYSTISKVGRRRLQMYADELAQIYKN